MAVSTIMPAPVVPRPAFRRKVEELSHQKITACYQCQKCTNGCPVTSAMDIAPHRVMHLLQLGMVDEVLGSDTIWACASCQTCTTRCPNGIDVAQIMDSLRKLSQQEGKVAQKNTPIFNSEFLSSIKQYGRLYELSMIIRYTLRSQGLLGFLKQTSEGLSLVVKGKLRVLPHSFWPHLEVRAIFDQAKRREPKR